MIRNTLVLLSVLLTLAFVAPSVEAQAPKHDFQTMISGIDTTFTKAEIEAQYPDAEKRTIEAAQHAKPWVRARAISLLGIFQSENAQQTLIQVSKDKNDGFRSLAAYTLLASYGKNAAAFAQATRLAQDKNEHVRAMTAKALQHLPASKVRGVLTKLGDDKSKFVRATARRVLASFELRKLGTKINLN